MIREQLLLDWSPEQISGWLKRAEICTSHEAIDLHVWKDKRQGGQLHTHLRHRGKKYNKRSSLKAGRGCIPDGVDIDERSAVVARKERLGDWEGDTVIGANHKGAILTLVDRKPKFRLFARLKRKTAEEVNKGVVRCFNRLLKEHPRFGAINRLARTITFDNGKEFSAHQGITEALGPLCYFAKPYHSWERGLNEHTNGLLRQYSPKKMRFSGVSDRKTQWIEDRLNDRPRKVLHYMIPREVMAGKHRPTPAALHF